MRLALGLISDVLYPARLGEVGTSEALLPPGDAVVEIVATADAPAEQTEPWLHLGCLWVVRLTQRAGRGVIQRPPAVAELRRVAPGFWACWQFC